MQNQNTKTYKEHKAHHPWCRHLANRVDVTFACDHPIAIIGDGDVTSATGTKYCYLEDFKAGKENCTKNMVIGQYQETYYAVPRSGWKFERWLNYCKDATTNECSFNISADLVKQNWGQVMPPLVAMFTRLVVPEICPDLRGTWEVAESVTLTITINGESETVTETATDTLEMTQDGCAVGFIGAVPLPGGGTLQAERVGTIDGGSVTFTGIAVVPVDDATCSKNSFVAVGTIAGNRIDATTTVDARCSAPGIVQTVTGSGTAVFMGPPPRPPVLL